MRIQARIKLQNERLNELRFTPLATTVYLSHLPNPTPSHHLSCMRLAKCVRNEGCFIFLQEIGRRNNKKHFKSVEIGEIHYLCQYKTSVPDEN